MNTPMILALVILVLALGLLLTGVYLLAGLGWACVAASVPPFVLALTLIKGLKRGE